MDPASFESSIAVRYWACMSHIYWLLNTLKDPRQHSGLGKSILQKSQIEGIRMKLQVWGDTTRASEWDWDSLGHQLRYSWDIRNQIMEVLVGLGTVLQQCKLDDHPFMFVLNTGSNSG